MNNFQFIGILAEKPSMSKKLNIPTVVAKFIVKQNMMNKSVQNGRLDIFFITIKSQLALDFMEQSRVGKPYYVTGTMKSELKSVDLGGRRGWQYRIILEMNECHITTGEFAKYIHQANKSAEKNIEVREEDQFYYGILNDGVMPYGEIEDWDNE